MRIIAGSARGRTIVAPKGQDTRPTQDYVRESLFNILQRDVPDARVLDLFAGSGALALEALSRGASEATLVDCSMDAIASIRRNVEALHFADTASILKSDWQAALARLQKEGKTYTLVFLDPPYRMADTGVQCTRMADHELLDNDALLVIEHRRECAPVMDARFICKDAREYGDTVIHFYRYQGGANNNE